MRMHVLGVCGVLLLAAGCGQIRTEEGNPGTDETFTLHPIGSVQKEDGHTYIVLKEK